MGFFDDFVDVVMTPVDFVKDEVVTPVWDNAVAPVVNFAGNEILKPTIGLAVGTTKQIIGAGGTVVSDVYGGVKGGVNLAARGAEGIVNKAGQVVDSGTGGIDAIFKWLPLIVVGGVIVAVVVVPALKDLKK